VAGNGSLAEQQIDLTEEGWAISND